MSVIHTLNEKRREKQMEYELSVLKELSLKRIKETVAKHFLFYFESGAMYKSVVEEGCIDYAIEAYLLGAQYSRFGYYGESIQTVRSRCLQEVKELTHSFYEYLICWGKASNDCTMDESIFFTSEGFIHSWWLEGYEVGEKRHKLRLL